MPSIGIGEWRINAAAQCSSQRNSGQSWVWPPLNWFCTAYLWCLPKLWGLPNNDTRACGEVQAISHIINDCPQTKFYGLLHMTDKASVNWLVIQHVLQKTTVNFHENGEPNMTRQLAAGKTCQLVYRIHTMDIS